MSNLPRTQCQAIEIAYNVVLAQIAIPTLQARHCALIRSKIGEILSKAWGGPIMEQQAARQFDALGREMQLLLLSIALADNPTLVSPGQEWTIFNDPLSLKTDLLDIQRARLLYFQWQGLAEPETSALGFLYKHWLTDALPERRNSNSPGSSRMVTSHA